MNKSTIGGAALAGLITGMGGLTIYNSVQSQPQPPKISEIKPDEEQLKAICNGIDINWAVEEQSVGKILTHPRDYPKTFDNQTRNLCKSRTFLKMGDWVAIQIYFINPKTGELYYMVIPPELRGEQNDRTLTTSDALRPIAP